MRASARTVMIITEQTPNPDSLMFYPLATQVLGSGAKTKTFANKAAAAQISPLATSLFKVHGVATVMLAARHVTVTKADFADWELLKPNLELVMSQFFAAGLEVIEKAHIEYYDAVDADKAAAPTGSALDDPTKFADPNKVPGQPSDSSIEADLVALLEQRVQPFVQQDGGDVEFVKMEDDIVYLRMMGACSGCPKSGITLNIQIKQLVQHYFPTVKDVQEYVDPEEEYIPRGH